MSASCCCSASALLANSRRHAGRRKAWFWALGGARLPHRALQLGLLRRPDPPQRLPDPRRPGRRHRRSSCWSSRRAAADGPAAGDHRRGIFLAYCFFGQYLPPPFIHRGYDFAQIVDHLRLRHRRHLRHAGLRVGRLHLHLRRVRRLPRTRRHDRAVQRRRARPGRRLARRAGAGLRAVVGADGHDLRLGRRQRGGERPVHHPADEALRLPRRLRRRRSRRPPRWAARSCRR